MNNESKVVSPPKLYILVGTCNKCYVNHTLFSFSHCSYFQMFVEVYWFCGFYTELVVLTS